MVISYREKVNTERAAEKSKYKRMRIMTMKAFDTFLYKDVKQLKENLKLSCCTHYQNNNNTKN